MTARKNATEIVRAAVVADEIVPESLPTLRDIIADAAVSRVDGLATLANVKGTLAATRADLTELRTDAAVARDGSKRARDAARVTADAVKGARVAVKGLKGRDRLAALTVNASARIALAESRVNVTGTALTVAAVRHETAETRLRYARQAYAATSARLTIVDSDTTIANAVEVMRAQ